MRITYDRVADAAYIYLAPKISRAQAANTYSCDLQAIDGQIQLDFDEAGHLIGIEILEATRLLPEGLLAGADRNSQRSGHEGN